MSAQSAWSVLGEAAGQLSVTVKDRFRNGSIDVVYVPHAPPWIRCRPKPWPGCEQPSMRLLGTCTPRPASSYAAARSAGGSSAAGITNVVGVLIGAAAKVRDARPDDNVVIVVGSSPQAMHRVVGSMAISLARRHGPERSAEGPR